MKCIYCGEVTENSIYCGEVTENSIDDEYVCSKCLESDFTSCDDCGVWVHNDNIRTVRRNREGSEVHVCERCAQKVTIKQ